MRLRHQRRVMRQVRRLRGDRLPTKQAVLRSLRRGASLTEALASLVVTPDVQIDRSLAARLLAIDGRRTAVDLLLRHFFERSDAEELYRTALMIDCVNDSRAVAPLSMALLQDDDAHRRRAAARALGWMWPGGRAARRALESCVADPTQPMAARYEAAESLNYVGNRGSIAALVSVVNDPDPDLRFWAAFGLGSCGRRDPVAMRALESFLHDDVSPKGNFWPIRLEALAMLRKFNEHYERRVEAEIERIHAAQGASAEERNWAGFYG